MRHFTWPDARGIVGLMISGMACLEHRARIHLACSCIAVTIRAAASGLSILIAGSALAASPAPKPSSAEPVAAHVEALGATLDPRAKAALDDIQGLGPRILALRGYLRGEARLGERWSWSRAEIADYKGSVQQAQVEAAVAKVRCEFEGANPGHTLLVNPVVRSLEAQVSNWSAHPMIRLAGDRLVAVARRSVEAPGFPRVGHPDALREFRRVLVTHTPDPTPALAPPGLSFHGQMRAIDFLVQRGGRIVAGPDVSRVRSVWHETGWTARLADAVAAADVGLEGPLSRPDEPWHYEFREAPAQRLAASESRSIGRVAANAADLMACGSS